MPESEIVKAYVKEILELPYTPTGNPKRIHELSEKLSHSVQSLALKPLHERDGFLEAREIAYYQRTPCPQRSSLGNLGFCQIHRSPSTMDTPKLQIRGLTVIPETGLRVPNTAKKAMKVCLLPNGRLQAVRMHQNHLTDRTQRISGFKKALFQLHRSAQIIGMQKYSQPVNIVVSDTTPRSAVRQGK